MSEFLYDFSPFYFRYACRVANMFTTQAIIEYIKQHRSDALLNFYNRIRGPHELSPDEVVCEIQGEFFDNCRGFWKWYQSNYPTRVEEIDADLLVMFLNELDEECYGDEPTYEEDEEFDDQEFQELVNTAMDEIIFHVLWDQLCHHLVGDSQDMDIA